MKDFTQDIPQPKRGFVKFLFTLAILFAIAAIIAYRANYFVIIRFKELGPITKNMSVYYNGFKIGKITSIKPDTDFKHILVKVNFNQRDINLPKNMVVYVERFPSGELYLQFAYPQSPSLQTIRRGDILEGITSYNLEQFMMGQSISGMSDVVSIHIIKALNAADAANQQMRVFFEVTSKVIKANDKGISASINNTAAMTKSLADMAENLNQASEKINKALDEETLKGAIVGAKRTTENIAKATENIDETMKKVDIAVSELSSTAKNLNSITSGVNETLAKRFGGMRIMFGSATKSGAHIKNACK